MKFTTHLELHSQAIRLLEHRSYATISESKTGFSPSMTTLFQKIYTQVMAEQVSRDYNSEALLDAPILTLSFSRFTRRY